MKKYILIILIIICSALFMNVEAEVCDKNTMSTKDFCSCLNSTFVGGYDYKSTCKNLGCYWKSNGSIDSNTNGVCYENEEAAYQAEKQQYIDKSSPDISEEDKEKACAGLSVYGSADTCEKNTTSGCTWINEAGGKCVYGKWYYSHANKPNLNKSGQSLTGETCSEINEKIQKKIYTQDFCTDGCEWNGKSCINKKVQYTCSNMTTFDECEAKNDDGEKLYPGCTWDAGKNKCIVNLSIMTGTECSKITDPDECNSIGKPDTEDEGICKYVNDKCIDNVSCKAILGGFAGVLKDIIKIFRIVAPLLVIALSTYDYIVAVISKDAEGLKKANDKIIKRLILVAVLFFLPTLVDLLLGLAFDGYSSCIS